MIKPLLTAVILIANGLAAVEPPAVLAAGRLVAEPAIDGDPSDPAWLQAAGIPALMPALGVASEVAGEALRTRVDVGWTSTALFVRMTMVDTDVAAGRAPADRLYLDDVAEVFVDGLGDGRHLWELQAAPDGRSTVLAHLVMSEPVYTEQGRLSQDFSQRERFQGVVRGDEGMQAAARRTDIGWVAEFRVAAAATLRRIGRLEFAAHDQLRAQFVRYDRSAAAAMPELPLRQANWTPVLTGCPHISAQRWGAVVLAP